MPVITIDLWPVSQEVKTELIQNLTKIASDITNIPQTAFFVYIREYSTDSIGVGGIPLSQHVVSSDTKTPPK